jgi:hypothetical protein
MSLNFFRRRNILKSANALDLVPIRLVKCELTDLKLVNLIVPRFQNELLKKIFTGRKLKPEFKVTLDEIGSYVWLAIDGQKNIETIIKEIKLNYEPIGFTLHDADNRVIAFFTRLYQEDYITFSQIL